MASHSLVKDMWPIMNVQAQNISHPGWPQIGKSNATPYRFSSPYLTYLSVPSIVLHPYLFLVPWLPLSLGCSSLEAGSNLFVIRTCVPATSAGARQRSYSGGHERGHPRRKQEKCYILRKPKRINSDIKDIIFI